MERDWNLQWKKFHISYHLQKEVKVSKYVSTYSQI